MAEAETTVIRDDPALTDEANRLIAAEVGAALGTPVERRPPEAGAVASAPARASRRATRVRSALAANRVLLMIMLCSGIVICSIFTLVTWSWWLTALSVAVLAGAALLVFRLVIETTTVVEKPSAEVVARLEDEGVADAEELLNVRIGELRGEGGNDRTVAAADDRARAVTEQRTAQTPSADPVDRAP